MWDGGRQEISLNNSATKSDSISLRPFPLWVASHLLWLLSETASLRILEIKAAATADGNFLVLI